MSEADTPNYGIPQHLNAENQPQTQPESDSSPEVPREHLSLANVPAASQSTAGQESAGEYWVEILDNGLATIGAAELAQMFDLIQELRSANSQLLDRVDELTQVVVDAEKTVQTHKKRSQAAESVINQQNQEIAIAQEQLKSLFQELEASHQTSQRQQILIETYKAQLDSSTERITHLEREYASLQANYNEQSHQLLQTQNSERELRSRLLRQQRQTMQYKAALEKYLDMAVSSSEPMPTPLPQGVTPPQGFFAKATPIKPWSAETDPLDSGSDNEHTQIAVDWESNTETAATEATEDDPTPTSLEDQLDAVIQMFFHSQLDAEEILPPTDVETDDSEVVEVDALQVVDQQPEDTTTTSEDDADEPEAELPPVTHESSYSITTTASPSPLVYPLRPPKGRKSLASVELPSFPQE